jgi:hypothetical protein
MLTRWSERRDADNQRGRQRADQNESDSTSGG